RSDKGESMRGIPHAYELAGNHTTLRALKVDPSFTDLQVQYPGPDHVAKVRKMGEIVGDEVPGHLEFSKGDGQIQCS
ncbi:FAD-binding protein, partial [Rhizobium ruizarguesonis]